MDLNLFNKNELSSLLDIVQNDIFDNPNGRPDEEVSRLRMEIRGEMRAREENKTPLQRLFAPFKK
jgi:hypothetical protein